MEIAYISALQRTVFANLLYFCYQKNASCRVRSASTAQLAVDRPRGAPLGGAATAFEIGQPFDPQRGHKSVPPYLAVVRAVAHESWCQFSHCKPGTRAD